MVIKINERFRAIFLKFIKDSEKSYSSYNYSGYGGGYNYGGYSNSCYRNGTLYIYFYEWSDMSRGNKVFRNIDGGESVLYIKREVREMYICSMYLFSSDVLLI